MNHIYKISFFLILTILSVSVYAQSFEHRKFHYDWKDEIRITLNQSEKYKNYNAVILHEETTLDVELRNIKRYQVIQFNDEAAIDEYNLFRVPIVMDPHLAALENIYRHDTASFPKLVFDKINFFDARIIRNGEFVKAVLDELAFRREERIGEYLIPFYVHYFYVRNLQPGDQLEVIISHEWPMFIFQYYLNERLPKQEAYVTINNTYLGEIDAYQNTQLGTIKSHDKSVDDKAHLVVYEDLEPVDPRFTTKVSDLPRIEMYVNKIPERSSKFFQTDLIDTLSWREILFRYVIRIDPIELRTWEIYDDQSYRTTLFYHKIKKMMTDTSDAATIMSFIHNYVADEMEYKNDFNFFIHEEPGFVDIGTYLQKGIFREGFRSLFYYHMLDRIDAPYYKSFLQDRRVFCLDTSVVTPLYSDNVVYFIYSKDSVPTVFFPKCHRFGWYANEIPFYFTGENTFLIPQTVPRKIYDRKSYLIQYPLLYLQPPPHAVNKKKVEAIVNISLASQRSTIQSSISLSGQFSTMVRGYYQYGWLDTTISATYYADVCKTIPNTEIKLSSAQKVFPYAHHFEIVTPAYQNVFSTIDGSYMIDLSNLIYMHYENLDPKYFKANFRHDFQGKDEFIVELNFDQLVDIENMTAYNQEILTDGFSFSSSLVKVADNQYGLKVIWDVKEDYTDTNNLSSLETAFKAIKKFTKLKIKVKPQ